MGRSRSRSPPRRGIERRRSRSRDRDRRRGIPIERRKSRSPTGPRRSPTGPRRRRTRSRSPRGRRSRSFSPRRRSRSPRDRSRNDRMSRDVEIITPPSSSQTVISDLPELSEAQMEGKTEDEVEMMKMMGFCNFDTTKGKKVGSNEIYVAHIQRKRRYRQYMNRKGGFNRPLDFIA